MTLAAVIMAALSLSLSAAALWVAVLSRGDSLTARRELARHRQSHAEQAEERRAGARAQTALRGTPPPEPPAEPRRARPAPSRHAEPEEAVTGELEAQDAPTGLIPVTSPRVTLPRPGRTAR